MSSIFTKMGTIVKMHEGMIERIDHNAEMSQLNVKKGKKEVKSIFEDVSNNRKLILKVFAIVILFALFYIVFLA